MKLICLNCKKEVDVPNNKTRKFCSLSCASKYNKHGGDTSSLKVLIHKYGELEGKSRHSEKSKKLSSSNMGRISPRLGKHWSEDHKKKVSELVKASIYHTNLRNVPLSEEKKTKISNKLKGTFTLEWFIEKHGNELGRTKYLERCERIANTTFFKKYNKSNKNNYSKISQELFWLLYKELQLESKDVYFAELNHEYGCETNTNFDFVIKNDKKVIEFNGNLWHGNPKIFKENDNPNPYNKELTAKQIWEEDQNKLEKAKLNGYDVLVVWQDEYEANKKEVVETCKKFLMNTM